MKEIPLSEVEHDLTHYLQIAEREKVVITRDGNPAGVLIGFETEDDWLDDQLEHDPAFLDEVAFAIRASPSANKSEPIDSGRPRAVRVNRPYQIRK